jgi:hypothetical protein
MKYVLLVSVLLILVVAVFLKRSSYVWHRYQGGEVLRNGNAVPGFRLFETGQGLVLIDVADRNEWYAFSLDGTYLGYCTEPRGFSVLGLWYVTKDETIPCVGYNPVKAEEAHLVSNPDFIEFDSRNGGRIRVTWRRN